MFTPFGCDASALSNTEVGESPSFSLVSSSLRWPLLLVRRTRRLNTFGLDAVGETALFIDILASDSAPGKDLPLL